MQNVQQLAKQMLGELHVRKVGTGEVVRLKYGAPDWMNKLLKKANPKTGRDNCRYILAYRAIKALAESESIDEAADSLEPDTEQEELLSWIASDVNRAEYVNTAMSQNGHKPFDLFESLAMGQLIELHEVFNSVREQLEEMDF